MQHTSIQSNPASKIGQAFARARGEGRPALMPYFMCGYPSIERSVELIVTASQAGADIIELGLPFSDPLADGPAVQYAGQQALAHGTTVSACMKIAGQVSAQTEAVLIFMGYYNPMMNYGLERFCQQSVEHGISGLIVPDLPLEEAERLQRITADHGLALIYLIPPTASEKRIARIVEQAKNEPRGFLYCVSLNGVTGARSTLPEHLHGFIDRVHKHSSLYALPLAIGFGLSTPAHIREIGSYADGAAVGSAIVNLIRQTPDDQQVEQVQRYIEQLSEKHV